MNIKQAKLRFTELTGYKATKGNVNKAIWAKKGYVADWYAFNDGYNDGKIVTYDSRTAIYWKSLVKFLKALERIA